MTPRELDAWLAGRLFGWAKNKAGTTAYASQVPRYSTTYEGMGRVLEAMSAKDYICNIQIGTAGNALTVFLLDGPGAGEPDWEKDCVAAGTAADTLTHGVALAAKAALEKEMAK